MTDQANPARDPSAAIITDLLGHVPDLTLATDALLAPLTDFRADLRDHLLNTNAIHPHHTRASTRTICAVDGASIIDRVYAADLLFAVAAAADGTIPHPGWDYTQARASWAAVVRHQRENDKLRDAAMIAHEVSLIANLPHGIRIYDGSHTTMYVALLMGLWSTSADVARKTAQVAADLDVTSAIRSVSDHNEDSWLVALPKSDSAADYTTDIAAKTGHQFPSGDRFLASQVLHRGEFLAPRPVTTLLPRTPDRRTSDPLVVAQSSALVSAVQSLVDLARSGRVFAMYTKPLTADTVVRAEFTIPDGWNYRDVIDRAAAIARAISDEVKGPYTQEPFCQYAVDRLVKNVSPGALAAKEAMIRDLGGKDYAPLLARSYRT